MRNIAKTVLVLGGLGTFFAFQGEVLAADSSILGQIIEQMNLDPEEIDCYDYVGFYISEETTTAGPTTTVVTTEATTTTETTTEEPTTTTSYYNNPNYNDRRADYSNDGNNFDRTLYSRANGSFIILKKPGDYLGFFFLLIEETEKNK